MRPKAWFGRPRGVVRVVLPAAVALWLTGCVSIEGQRDAIDVSLWQRVAEDYGGQDRDVQVQARIESVGQRLIAHLPPAQRQRAWSFTVLATPHPQAFSTPEGRIGLTRGLVDRLERDDELAAVLAHEMGHVVAEDLWAFMVAQIRPAGFVVGPMSVVRGGRQARVDYCVGLVNRRGLGFWYPFGLADELAADRFAQQLLQEAGYKPDAVASAIRAAAGLPAETFRSWGGTHGHHRQRLEALEGRVGQVARLSDRPGAL